LDGGRLNELASLFPGDEMAKLLAELTEEIEGQLARLAAAIARGDQADVAAAAHRITNSGRMVGAEDLTRSATLLDELAGEGRPADWTAVDAAAQTLFSYWEKTRAAISAELEGSGDCAPGLAVR
jgi:HPt (histidine-containing phosphotransfer) domain-containing protein